MLQMKRSKKKEGDVMSIPLERTDDILKYLGEHKEPHQFLCGFSMETQNMLENSKEKLMKKESGYDRCQQSEGTRCRI